MKRYVYVVENWDFAEAVFSSKAKAHEYARKHDRAQVTVFVLDDVSWPMYVSRTTEYRRGKAVPQ